MAITDFTLENSGGGGANTLYTADDTIGAGRIATLTDTLTFAGTNTDSVSFGTTYIKTANTGYTSYAIYVGNGTVACQQNGAFQILSYNSQLAKNYLSLYGGNTILTGTSAGLATISQTTSPTYNIGARFGIVGLGSTSATTNLRLEDSAGNRQLQMYDDGLLALETQSSTGANLSFYSAGGGSLIATFQKTSSTGLLLNMRSAGTTFFYTRDTYTAFPYWGGSWRGVKIGGANASPDVSSCLELDSTVKGFLQPRMTGVQVEAIGSPATGLQVYATSAGAGDVIEEGWWGYDGTDWVQGFSGGGTTLYSGDSILSGARNVDLNFHTLGFTKADGGVSIGIATADSSAILELSSDTQGFLPTRMSTAEINLIGTPAKGLMVYDTDTDQWMGNNGTPGSPNWVIIG